MGSNAATPELALGLAKRFWKLEHQMRNFQKELRALVASLQVLAEEITAIEHTLGAMPQDTHANVRARLEDIERRIAPPTTARGLRGQGRPI